MYKRLPLARLALACLTAASYAFAQPHSPAQTPARISQEIDGNITVTLKGNVHPLVAKATASEAADWATPMQHMVLHLKASDAQEAQLEQLIADQSNPKSAHYHRYLTPQEFGAQFGVSQADMAKVKDWLEGQGFRIEEVPAGNRSIIFSGNVAQVNSAFKTEIRKYTVAGKTHFANASDPQIPAALAPAVGGVLKLHDFRSTAHNIKGVPLTSPKSPNPQFTYGSSHYLAPADYATIYDINPLYAAGVSGTGQSIAVLARSDIYMSDVTQFRSTFGLKANNPVFVVTNSDPGVQDGDTVETTLDTEWSGAVAPGATVKVIISASTSTADGIDLSAIYAVNNNVAPVVTLSYGSCEAFMGATELALYNSLWKQAAAQGQTVLVSAGDAGAAGCDGGSETKAAYGQAVNGLCTSPYSTCVGGTEFAEGSNPGQYWLPGNSATDGSAISYIPETVWNESGSNGGSGLWSGGGGASITYSKPTWQTGVGVPADGKRDVPDVSLSASGHDGYVILIDGQLESVGGTSAAAPSFAGLMALVDQKTAASQGCINPILYPLATRQAAGGAAIFHDTTTGNNTVPGITGFSATTGYDLASGLGSVDANVMVNNWSASTPAPASLSLAVSAATLTVNNGQSATSTITSTAVSLSSAVALTVAGAPTGLTATFAPASIASPGSGTSVLTVAASSTVTAGTYTLTVTGSGASHTATATISVTITTPGFTMTPAATTVNATVGATTPAQVALAFATQNGFSSAIALSASTMPAGVTATFSPASVAATATASSTLSFALANTAKAGSYPVTITATGGGVTHTSALTLVVTALPASLSLTASTPALTLNKEQSGVSTITAAAVSLNSAVALTVSGAPAGLTATLAPASIASPGSGTSVLTVAASSTVAAGTYTLTVTGTAASHTATATISVTITTPGFTMTPAAATINAIAGSATPAQVAFAIATQNGFSAPISLSASALPAGVTASFSPATVSTTAAGSSTLSFAVAKTAKAGSYPVTITATGGGITHTSALTLVVTLQAQCSFTANPTSISLTAGKSASVALACAVTQGVFNAPLTLSLSSAPTGVTAQLSSASLIAGSSATLNLASALTTTAGNYSLSITAAGSGYTQTIALPLVIAAASTFTATPSATTVTVTSAAAAHLNVTTAKYGTFNSAVALSASGLPAGVTAAFSTSSIAAPGNGSATIEFAATSAAKAGTYTVTLSAIGGGQTQTMPVTLTVAAAANFTLATNVSSLTMAQGAKSPVVVSTGNFTGGFNSTITITFSGLGPGMNWAVTGASTGNNLVNTTDSFSAASNTPVGVYPVTITATGAGITHTAVVQMTVTAATAAVKH